MESSDEMPVCHPFRPVLEMNDIKSASLFPLMAEGATIGILSLSTVSRHRVWNENESVAIGFLCQILTNVLLRKEHDLAHYEHELILNSTNDGIVMLDRDGKVLNMNRKVSETIGKPLKDLVGLKFSDIFPSEMYQDYIDKGMAALSCVFDTGEAVQMEYERNGRTYNYRLYPVVQENSVTAATLFTTDITAQKKAMQEAAKAAEYNARLNVITDFFTNISHEFKTPLTIILNAIEMTEIRLKDLCFANKDKALKTVSIMRQNSHRLLRLIGNLLDVTKIDSGFLQVNLSDIKISEWLGRLLESVIEYADRRGIEVRFIDECQILCMPVDCDKLDRIMLNLLSNSIKHTVRGGRITVTLSDSVEKVLICVEDDGEGIPEEKKEIIFNRFRQVNTSLTRASEGSGIGLALTKGLVELLQGRIWFESRFGEGTRFFVELPVLQIEPQGNRAVMEGMAVNRKVEMEFSDII